MSSSVLGLLCSVSRPPPPPPPLLPPPSPPPPFSSPPRPPPSVFRPPSSVICVPSLRPRSSNPPTHGLSARATIASTKGVLPIRNISAAGTPNQTAPCHCRRQISQSTPRTIRHHSAPTGSAAGARNWFTGRGRWTVDGGRRSRARAPIFRLSHHFAKFTADILALGEHRVLLRF